MHWIISGRYVDGNDSLSAQDFICQISRTSLKKGKEKPIRLSHEILLGKMQSDSLTRAQCDGRCPRFNYVYIQ